MKLVILGAGGYARTVCDIAEQTGTYTEIMFLDDNAIGTNVIGKCADFKNHVAPDAVFYPAFGSNEARLFWLDTLQAAGANIFTYIHKTAYVSPKSTVEVGTVVLPNAVVGAGVTVKRGCLINCGAIIDHDCVIEEGVHVCLGAIIKADNRIPRLMKVEAKTVIENRYYPLNGEQ